MYTVTFPYLLLIILFIRGVTLPGAGEGLKYLFIPNFQEFSHPFVRAHMHATSLCSFWAYFCHTEGDRSAFAGLEIFFPVSINSDQTCLEERVNIAMPDAPDGTRKISLQIGSFYSTS